MQFVAFFIFHMGKTRMQVKNDLRCLRQTLIWGLLTLRVLHCVTAPFLHQILYTSIRTSVVIILIICDSPLFVPLKPLAREYFRKGASLNVNPEDGNFSLACSIQDNVYEVYIHHESGMTLPNLIQYQLTLCRYVS